MSGIGIIAGALGGAAQATGDMAQQQLDLQNKQTFAQQMADIDVQKAQRIDEARVALETQQRQAMAQRIGDAQDNLVNSAVNSKYAGSDAAVAAANAGQTDAPLTPDQRAAIQQSKDLDSQSLRADPSTYIAAATQTGDLDPKTIATNTSRYEVAGLKAHWEAQRVSDMAAYHQGLIDVKQQLVDARVNNDQSGRLMASSMLTNAHTDLESARKEYDSLSQSLSAAKTSEKPDLQARMTDLRGRIDTLRGREDFLNNYMLGKLNIPGLPGASPAPTAAPAPSPAAAAAPADPTHMSVAPAEQSQRDAEAGTLMIQSQYGGDLTRAATALQRLRAVAAQGTGDTAAMVKGEADRLEAGINAMRARGGAKSPTAVPGVPKGWTVKQVGAAAPDDQDDGMA